jgi:glycosyltransferase involved in cell wall biosynthesis
MKDTLRVLHIVQSMNSGGIETVLMNFYRNINRDNIQFDFLLTSPEKCDYEDEIVKLGGNVFRMSPISISAPFQYLADVDRFFKEHTDYKIVHAHMSAVSALPLYIAKKNNIPVRISHSHNNGSIGIKRLLKWILKFPLKSVSNNYFACSVEAANFLYGKWFFGNRNCYLLKNAIDAQSYVYNPAIRSQIRKQYNIDSKIVIGHVGRFNRVKNHGFILDVFKSIHEINPDSVLMLVGDGDLRVKIQEKISALGFADSVILTGLVQNVPDYLQAMDIYLFPSLIEGLGMSLIEAQSAGLHCFASDTIPKESAVTDLVKFISLSENPGVWADKILKLDNKYERTDTLLQVQSAGYDVKTSSKWLEDFYITKNNEC